MKKIELMDLLKDLADDSNIDEVVKGSQIAELFKKDLTLDEVKNFLETNQDGKKYIQSYGDKRVTEGIEKFKNGSMQTIINDEILRATGKKKSPEQIQIEELQKKFEEQEQENTRLKNQSTVKSMISSCGLDPEKYFEYIGIQDMEKVKEKIENLKVFIGEDAAEMHKAYVASGGYTPPGENGSGDLTVDDIAKMMM